MLYSGDITRLSDVDCIVNSTDPELRHSGGAAAAIKKTAGPGFLKLCEGQNLGVAQCISTGAGNLPHKRVLHVFLERWESWNDKRFISQLKSTIWAVLNQANKDKMRSLALSGIGTGALKFPIDKWVKCVVDVIKDYAKRFMKDKALKEIHFVDKNPEFLRRLEEGLLKVFPQTWSQPNSQETTSSKQSSASSESHQLTTFHISGPCQVVVQKTDITTFQGDAIVITVDKNISGPLSDAVSRAAGQEYTAEKDKKLRDKAGDVFVTDAGQLPCKYVVHALLSGSSTRKDDIGALVTCVLSEAEAVKIQTIAFPAISTGFVGMSVNAGCQLLVDNISSYMKNNPSTFLKKIYLVDIDEKKVDQFRVLLTQQISTLKKEQHELTPNHGYSTLQKSPDSPKLESKTKDDSSTLSTQRPVENRLPARFAISDSCTVEVEKADFRTFEGDALVVTVREDFTTASGQDLALTMTAGEKYYEELKQKKSAKPGDVVVTGAGNMGYGHVIHGVWDTKHSSGVGELRTLVPRILNKADELEMKTLVVPPLWTGLLNITTHDGCSAVVEGIFRFVTILPDISVKIYLMDTDMNTLDCYCKELRKRVPNLERVDPIQASGGGDVSMSGMSRADDHQPAVWSDALCFLCQDERVSAKVRRCGHALCGACVIPGLDVQFCCKESSNPSAHTIPGIEAEKDEEDCVICLCPKTDPKSLQCGHKFCKDCIEEYFSKCAMLCPVCKAVCGKVTGNQPYGTMKVEETYKSCAGYQGYKSLIIHYNFPNGIQQEGHPNPGMKFRGARRRAYLPNNSEGKRVLRLLRRAFDQRLTFTVGTSMTSGRDNVVTWNDIHHKTSMHLGPERFGYPDPTYLSRVREELRAKGIVESDTDL
ncbi:protein mono-ADP-ribosyltransferase PARP14-like [Liolophura sinensis]|uniref:protein mono-ADP-ribosyltransferase PARP14-like n=1 Tax=Liolophura sinensis TaxID=3198878 RepID=UPI0031591FE7